MQRKLLLSILLLFDAIAFGVFPTYMVVHIFLFQVVPGPPVVASETTAYILDYLYFALYPLEMWAPWLLLPALVAPATAILILSISTKLLRGNHELVRPFILAIGANQLLEILAAALILFFEVANRLSAGDTLFSSITPTALTFAGRLLFALLVFALNWALLVRTTSFQDAKSVA